MLADLFYESPIPEVSLVCENIPRLVHAAPTSSRLPIGKRFESQVIEFYSTSSWHTILAHNLQIIDGGKTLGELDLIVRDDRTKQVWHIEIVRKFYRYEQSLSEQGHYPWVGPADRDHLSLKCNHLAQHQFPMLFHPATAERLRDINLEAINLKQGLLFKADLFCLPEVDPFFSSGLNKNALRGDLVYFENIETLDKLDQYHICHRQEWLMHPTNEVMWSNFNSFIATLNQDYSAHHALLIWRKKADQLSTFLLVPHPKQ